MNLKPPAPALIEWTVGSPEDVGVALDDSTDSEAVGVADEDRMLSDVVCGVFCAIVDEK